EYDPITGEKLSAGDRVVAAGFLALTFVPPAKAAGVGGKAAVKGVKAGLPSLAKTPEAFTKNEYPGYRDQVSFKDGDEVSHGAKNSSRPDFYINGHSIEVKNCKVTTSSGRSNLI